jgi:putative ABC transport system ATP-binding protein
MSQPVFDTSLFKYILRYSWKAQLFILVVTLTSLPFYYASLDVPKQIINKVLDPQHRDHLRPPSFLGFELDVFHGDRFRLLGFLCVIFLFFVLVNGGFKLYINVLKGRLGERMLRRLRYQLYDTILRFPLPHFRKTSEGELINMITAEVEPVGGFIGDAFVVPLYQGRAALHRDLLHLHAGLAHGARLHRALPDPGLRDPQAAAPRAAARQGARARDAQGQRARRRHGQPGA